MGGDLAGSRLTRLDIALLRRAEEAGYRPLREMAEDGLCEIGAHLQPWANPPFEEDVGRVRNSYAGNLPPRLEAEIGRSVV